MWIVYALASALFAGSMSILAKIGLKNTDATLATALRTVIVVIFAWLMAFITDAPIDIGKFHSKNIIFLVLSGLASGGSWLCYFQALQIGDVNKVVPVDKSSTVITMLLSFILLNEKPTWSSAMALILIGIGTYLMIERKQTKLNTDKDYKWLAYALLSALFASSTAILGKVGITGIESNLGTAIRTVVILLMAWLIVFMQGKHHEIRDIDQRSWLFIGISGITTGLSWMCFYRALQEGPVSAVVPIDKLSIIVTVIFSYFVLHEKINKIPLVGLIMIVIGTLGLVFL